MSRPRLGLLVLVSCWTLPVPGREALALGFDLAAFEAQRGFPLSEMLDKRASGPESRRIQPWLAVRERFAPLLAGGGLPAWELRHEPSASLLAGAPKTAERAVTLLASRHGVGEASPAREALSAARGRARALLRAGAPFDLQGAAALAAWMWGIGDEQALLDCCAHGLAILDSRAERSALVRDIPDRRSPSVSLLSL